MRDVQPWEVKWTVNHLNMLQVHGTWSIPRSGMIYTKTGEKEVTLSVVMPFMAEMARMILDDKTPLTEEKLKEIQKEDFYCVAARARIGGYTVKSNIDFIPAEEQTT
jgi:hypothetical protein